MTKNIIYLRVSKPDLKGEKAQQDIDSQLPPIFKKFGLREKDCKIIKDKGSAYDMSKLSKREGFLNLLDQIIESDSIKSLFFKLEPREKLNLYIYDYNRLFRSIEYGLLFYVLCQMYNVNIFSVNQEGLNRMANEEIAEVMARYMKVSMYSFLAEGYSKNISDHTKKAFTTKSGFRIDKSGYVLGKGFITTNGNRKKFKAIKYREIINYIKRLINDFKPFKPDTTIIKEEVKQKYSLMISDSFISEVKNGKYNGDRSKPNSGSK